MLSFEPPDLQEKLCKAVKSWVEKLELELSQDSNFLEDLYSKDFDLHDYEDIKIDSEYLIEITLPDWDEIVEIACQDFIDLLEEVEEAKLYGNKTCRSNKRLITRVSEANEAAVRFFYHAFPDVEDEKDKEVRENIINLREEISILEIELGKLDFGTAEKKTAFEELLAKREYEQEWSHALKEYTERFCIQKFVIDNVEICCSLIQGFCIFGILVACEGRSNEYLPPVIDGEIFVEIRFSEKISESLENNIFAAYLFELSSSLNLSFEISPRPSLDDDWLYDKSDNVLQNHRLRPLMLGKGLTELLGLYNRAIASKDLDVRVLYFTKAVEYVSQTVVRLQSNEAIRRKLLSSQALQPDADFISELESVFETQRTYRKDKEAIRQTIVTCCEASELAKIAPAFIKEFKQISTESSSPDKNKALEALARSLYATRNEIAHAKANYQPTGEECPKDKLLDFTECVQVATQQVIRWYYFSPESIAVLGRVRCILKPEVLVSNWLAVPHQFRNRYRSITINRELCMQ